MNYYNEFDPKAAAWLRELIAENLIPPGHVDERSITEVQPKDLKGYTQAHFFAGIGGWPLALQLAGWPPDRSIWTGSCPCPPFSAAGKKKACPECHGTSPLPHVGRTGVFVCVLCGHEWPADPRHLWPEMWRLIRDCRPVAFLGEQVASDDGRTWLAAVRTTLEILGYAAWGADLCAPGVGAVHIRQRLFFGAHQPGQLGNLYRPELDALAHGNSKRHDQPDPSGIAHRNGGLRQLSQSRSIDLLANGQRPNHRSQTQPTHHPQPEAHRSADWFSGCSGACDALAYGDSHRAQRARPEEFIADAGCPTNPLADRQSPEPTRQRPQPGSEPSRPPDRDSTRPVGDSECPERRQTSQPGTHDPHRPDPGRTETASGPELPGAIPDPGSTPDRRRRQGLEIRREPPARPECSPAQRSGVALSGQHPDGIGRDGGCPHPDTESGQEPWPDLYRAPPSWTVAYILCRDGKARPVPVESVFQPVADGLPDRLGLGGAERAYPLTAHKIPHRAALIKGAGNAIVPELAAQFILAWLETATQI